MGGGARPDPDAGVGGDVLQLAGLHWRSTFEHSPIGAALVGNDGTVVLANDELGRLAGGYGIDLVGTPLDSLCVDGESVTGQPQWRDLLIGARRAWDVERSFRGARGSEALVRLSLSGLTDEDLAVHGVLVQVQDLTASREAELALAAKAMNDDLTGLPNRWLTREWIERAVAEQPAAHVGVLSIDLDRTKQVNESLGHTAGDRLLTEVGRRLRESVGSDDFVGRAGGDEFLVVFEGIADTDDVVRRAEALAARFAEPMNLGVVQHTVTVSMGVAVGVAGEHADDFVIRADIARSRAKEAGGACLAVYDPDHDHATSAEDLALERDLRASVGAGELRAYYQPIVRLPDCALAGYEALVRWAHAERGLMVPDTFMRVAESSGLTGSIGSWMLERSCREAAVAMPAGLAVAVNVSPMQLHRAGYVDAVRRALTASGLPPARLHLEITETALLHPSRKLLDDLHALDAMGVTLALDDFGTGYSSLTLLQDLPVHKVKIDRSFVAPLLVDRRARATVKAVVGLCADLGLDTVAEGVEESRQVEVLAEMGCGFGQGYLFGRPAPLPPVGAGARSAQGPGPTGPAARSTRSG